jgi:hypothetical protein
LFLENRDGIATLNKPGAHNHIRQPVSACQKKRLEGRKGENGRRKRERKGKNNRKTVSRFVTMLV